MSSVFDRNVVMRRIAVLTKLLVLGVTRISVFEELSATVFMAKMEALSKSELLITTHQNPNKLNPQLRKNSHTIYRHSLTNAVSCNAILKKDETE